MTAGDHERLINRIRQTRRAAKTTDPRPARDADGHEERIAHLEQLLEGLQDSVHRESQRQDRRIAELEARIQPAALGEALSRDARERGL